MSTRHPASDVCVSVGRAGQADRKEVRAGTSHGIARIGAMPDPAPSPSRLLLHLYPFVVSCPVHFCRACQCTGLGWFGQTSAPASLIPPTPPLPRIAPSSPQTSTTAATGTATTACPILTSACTFPPASPACLQLHIAPAWLPVRIAQHNSSISTAQLSAGRLSSHNPAPTTLATTNDNNDRKRNRLLGRGSLLPCRGSCRCRWALSTGAVTCPPTRR